MDKYRRHQLIKEILQQQTIRSQWELLEALTAKGIKTTQATVSRDLSELEVHKKKTSRGLVYYYEASDKSLNNKLAQIFSQFVFTVQKSANLIVLKTSPAAAQTVAASLDEEKVPGVLGTVAGDDTVLVVVEENQQAGQRLKAYFDSLLYK